MDTGAHGDVAAPSRRGLLAERRAGGVRWGWLLLLALSPLAMGMKCGPTPQEAGGAVVIASPLALAGGLGLMRALLALWRRSEPGLRMDYRPILVGIGVAVVAALVTALGLAHTDVWEWVGLAAFLFGSSFCALLLITWRIWLALDRARAFGWAWLPVILLQVVPAVIAATAGDSPFGAADEVLGFLWVLAGYFGAVPSALVLIFVIEALIRGRGWPVEPPGA